MTSSPAHELHEMSIESEEIVESDESVSVSDSTISESEKEYLDEMAPPVAPTTVADALLEAHFVKLVVYPSGDCVMATALLRSALTALETPHHITTARTPDEAKQAIESTESTTTVLSIGVDMPRVERAEPISSTHSVEGEGNTASNDESEENERKGNSDDNGTGDTVNVNDSVTKDEQCKEGGTDENGTGTDTDTGDDRDVVVENERGTDIEVDERLSDTKNGKESNTADVHHTTNEKKDEGEESGSLFDVLGSVPTDVPIRRSDDEAEAEARETNSVEENAEDSENDVRSASQADAYRHLHPAERGVKMATETIERSAIGTEPLPPDPEDNTAGNGRGAEDTMWALSGFTWNQQRLRNAAHRHQRTDRQPIDEENHIETVSTNTTQADRTPSIKEAAAVAGQPSSEQRATPDKDSVNEPTQEDDSPETSSNSNIEIGGRDADEETDSEDGPEIGTAQFISDGGKAVSPSVSPGAILHVDTQLHEQDRDTALSNETLGNVSAGVSASTHAASTVASLATRTEIVSSSNPVCALAGMMIYSSGANADFDLGNISTWPSQFGASTYCERAQKQGVTSEIGLGTPLTSTPSAVQHTTFVHANFTGSAAAVARFIQSCPLIDVFPDADNEGEWNDFSSIIRRKIQPNRSQRDDTDEGLMGATTNNSSPRFTQSSPPLLSLLLGCHRLPDDGQYTLPTVEGYAEILETLSRNGHIAQALSVASQIGNEATESGDTDAVDDALARWETLGEVLHECIREAERIDCNEHSIDGEVYRVTETSKNGETVSLDHIAILLDQYRSKESPTLVASENEAAAVGSHKDGDGILTARKALADVFSRPPESIGSDGNVAHLTVENNDVPLHE